MKKLALLLSTLLIALTVASCGSSSTITTENPDLANVATSITESLKLAEDSKAEVEKLDDATVEKFNDTVADLNDLGKKVSKASKDLDQDTIDEYTDKARLDSTVILSIISQTTGDTTTEYKTYDSAKDKNADIKNEIISIAKDCSKARMAVKDSMSSASKDDQDKFNSSTTDLYNLEQTIHNTMDSMSKEDLEALRDTANDIKTSFEDLKK